MALKHYQTLVIPSLCGCLLFPVLLLGQTPEKPAETTPTPPAATIAADEAPPASSDATNAPTLLVDVRRDVVGTDMPYRYAFITAGKEKYTFLVPDGYRVNSSDPTKIKLTSPDFSCLITVGSCPQLGSKADADALRNYILNNQPGATITATETTSANGQTAPALDYVWKTESGVTRFARTSLITTTSGLMEFTVAASPDQFNAGLAQFHLITLTFRTGANGEFEYVIGSKYP